MNKVYLDANASYGLLEEIEDELKVWYPKLFNPNAIHTAGQELMAAIESSREALATLSGCSLRDFRIIFNSGATESNNAALNLCFDPASPLLDRVRSNPAGAHIVCSAIEHASVLAPTEYLHRHRSINRKVVSPDPERRFTPEAFVDAVDESTLIVSLMFANNETGEILPVGEISRAIKARYPEVVIHCDAVQGLGKVKQDFSELDVDILTFSAHKLGGLPGVGAMVVRRGLECHPLIRGGSQETRWRAGTQNSPGILSFGLACHHVLAKLDSRISAMRERRDLLMSELKSAVPEVQFNLFGESQIPNTLNIWLPGLAASDVLVALDLEGVYASSGSACSSGKPVAAEALVASGLSVQRARESIRLSWRADEPLANFTLAAEVFAGVVKSMGGITKELEIHNVA